MKFGCVAKILALALLSLSFKTALGADRRPWPVEDIHSGVYLWHEGPNGEWIHDDSLEAQIRVELNQACSSERFSGATTLEALLPQIRVRLLDRSAVADFGRPWQAGDVVGDETLPYRRIAASALGEKRAFVALEHGGGPNYVEFWLFGRIDGAWNGRLIGSLYGAPISLPELLYQVCAGYPKPAPRPKRAQPPSLR